MFDFRALRVPIVQAPMAGGPSTPELAAAVSNAGALGFLAAGYRSADALDEQIHRTRLITGEAFGVNLFVPQPSVATAETLAAYAAELAPDAAGHSVETGVPHPDDDAWAEKLDVLLALRPAVASFTFGSPDAETIGRLGDAEVLVTVTVTSLAEAQIALSNGAPVLVLQGPLAGGHRGTFDPAADPPSDDLDTLFGSIHHYTDAPLVAAGGLTTPAAIAHVLARGAVAAQAGTAFLLAREAGTTAVQRAALVDEQFTDTAVTRAFSGRPARGLLNDFMRRHDPAAPLGYPEVNQLTMPLRAAATAAGDPHGTNVWAGADYRSIRSGSAAEIVRHLAKEIV
ncbi:nitronate monooxygenase [Herbiconiux sp. CPCC 205763]|uniref:Propionate 3-nitronate monooxygenase n=1 Tax=Herbiconiux aconitum TaxID=2970913 RepID=A0ABT2GNY3_9MICO|nr:nitronate monooxygenase [Herbiconiux aconitum]MCS5717943.1 nitronate monooxygenase [Herbiconiux aconitum]